MKAGWARAAIAATCMMLLVAAGCSYTRPKVTITYPSSDEEIEAGRPIEVQSMATDRLGLKKIELWVDQELICSNDAPEGDGQAVASRQSWTAIAPGSHTLTVLAYNRTGEVSEPAWVKVRVVPAGASPSPTPNEAPSPPEGSSPVPTPMPTATLACTPRMEFLEHVTTPDKTVVAPGEKFVKTWRVRNTGQCDWANYSLVALKGEAMGARQNDLQAVAAGAEVEISVKLVAPAAPGTYEGVWGVRSPAGDTVGALNCLIVVRPPAPPTPVVTCTDGMQVLADVTVPQKSTVAAGKTFTKTWRVRNTGTCDWKDALVVPEKGEAMGLQRAPVLDIAPGQEGDISVELTAPKRAGTFEGAWSVRHADDRVIGALAASIVVPPKVAKPGVCTNSLEFIEDVTLPDRSSVPPGARLTKIWRVRNTGSCEWIDYRIYHVGGADMGFDKALVPRAQPGDTIDIYANLIMPEQAGEGVGFWRIEAPDGKKVSGVSCAVIVDSAAPLPTEPPPPTVAPPPEPAAPAAPTAPADAPSPAAPPVPAAPAAPSGLALTGWAGDLATLVFTDNAGDESGFRVYANGSAYRMLEANSSSFQAGPGCGNTYSIKVTAFNDAGESAASNAVSISGTCPAFPAGSPPAAPNDLSVLGWTGAMADLRFNDLSDNEEGFRVYADGGLYRNLGAGLTQFQVGPNCGSTYTIEVRAFNSAGESGASNTVEVNGACPPPASGIPQAPTGLALFSQSGEAAVMIYADNSSNETGFRAYVNDELVATMPVNQRTFEFPAACGANYAVRVTAYNANGESPPTNTVAVTGNCPANSGPGGSLAAPSGLALVDWDARTANVTFVDNSDNEGGFRVYANGSQFIVLPAGANAFQVSPGCGKTYAIEVRAYNAAGESPASNTVEVVGQCP